MPRRDPGDSGLPPDLQAAISQLSVDEMRALLPQLLSLGADAARASHEPVPSRRRPRRPDVVTYRVRLDLHGARPPVWRRLELASDLSLDVVHEVVQAAMGWTDSHLHAFSSGASPFEGGAERYLTEYDVEEGDEGVLENDVRLDEVLQDVGDRLFYEYDFGDGWTHVLRLEAVLPREEGAPPAVCTAGKRACPPEDVGGVWIYNELVEVVTADAPPEDEHMAMLLDWLPDDFDPAEFSVDEVNDEIRAVVSRKSLALELPEPVRDLLRRARRGDPRRAEELVSHAYGMAGADDSVVDVATAVAAYAWLLRRVRPDGLKLTASGYLPPAVVKEVVDELDLDREWVFLSGSAPRESDTFPALEFRESAQQLGLLRKHSGRLSVTARGRALADDPRGLWEHIAFRLPLGRSEVEREAGTAALLYLAGGGKGGRFDETVAEVLSAVGWHVEPQLTASYAVRAAGPTLAVLRRTGCFGWGHHGVDRSAVTPTGRALALAALATESSRA